MTGFGSVEPTAVGHRLFGALRSLRPRPTVRSGLMDGLQFCESKQRNRNPYRDQKCVLASQARLGGLCVPFEQR
jgi:hypothetical protein